MLLNLYSMMAMIPESTHGTIYTTWHNTRIVIGRTISPGWSLLAVAGNQILSPARPCGSGNPEPQLVTRLNSAIYKRPIHALPEKLIASNTLYTLASGTLASLK